MKNYTSNQEGVWNKILNPVVTEENLVILKGTDSAEKTALIEFLKLSSSEVVEDNTELVALYNSLKPELKETDSYFLISMNVCNNKGILNYRLNGEHVQIRF